MEEMKKIIVLNDQGGVQMDVSYDVTGTLRAQDHGHPPCVLVYDARGNGGVLYALPSQAITWDTPTTTWPS